MVAAGQRQYFGVRGKGLKGACGHEAVESQHETGVGGSLHPFTKGYYPK